LTISNKRKVRATIFLILCSFVAAHFCFWLLPNVFEIWNSQAIDQLFQFRSSSKRLRPAYTNTIVHVDFNNTSIRKLEDLYLNRSHFAQVTRNLASMLVSAQVYDFIFAARLDKENDGALIKATQDAGNVYFGLAFELWQDAQPRKRTVEPLKKLPYLDQTKWRVTVEGDPRGFYIGGNPLITFSDLAYASKGLGSLSIKFDRDGVLRRVPLIVRYEGGFYPILPFRAICDYLKVPPEKILVKPGESITLQDARRPGQASEDIVIPIDHHGNMIVNYIGPWGQMDHYNFADIFLASDDRVELEMWTEELRGKILVISNVSTGSTDVGPVPTDANFPLSGVHANIMHGILTQSFLRELSDAEMLIVEVLLLAIVLLISIQVSSIFFSIGALLVAGLYIGTVSMGFFYGDLIFHVVRPLLMVVFAVVSIVIYRYIHEEREKMESLRQRDFVRQTFGRYLSREVVEELLGSPGGLELGGEIREVTFLVSDLRGFTALSISLSPQEVIDILNRYLSRMVEIIRRYRGTLNEIEGDGILTFFGAPLVGSDDHERAVACAIEMQNVMEEINTEQRRLKLPELAMGIGIDTGEVVVGNIGSEERAKYSAIGSPINTAYRVESYTVGGQILISPNTYVKVKPLVQVRRTMDIQFKGIDQPVTLYDVSGMGGTYQVTLPEKETHPFIKVEPPIPIVCLPLEGKIVSEASVSGHMTHFGGSTAEVSLEQQLGIRSNLKILITSERASKLSQVYAKVMSIERSEVMPSRFKARLEFTWLPDDVKAFLNLLL
jgi:class 3 adenylate cyclase/CHASE2 domain-containing sensor protein